MRTFLAILISAALLFAASAQPVDDARTKALFSELRCVVCQNQSILDSDADVARDLRQIVREQIAEGRSDGQIRDFLVARYGEFILLKPVIGAHTVALWAAPFLLLLLGIALAWRSISGRRAQEEAKPLDREELAELQKILKSQKQES